MQTILQKKYFLITFYMIICLVAVYKFRPDTTILFFKTNQTKIISVDKKDIRTFIVNLDRSTDRYISISKQLDDNNLIYERFKAVDGYDLQMVNQNGEKFTGLDLKNDPSLLLFDKNYTIRCPSENISYNTNSKKTRYTLTSGELGCYCSHREIWFKMVKENIPYALIIEDDAVIDVNFHKQYSETLKNLPAEWDLIYLFLAYSKNNIFRDVYNNPHLKKIIRKGFNTTTSYLISQEGARKLLKHSMDFNLPIDNNMEKIIIQYNLQAYATIPFLVKAPNVTSTISEMGRTR